MTRTILVPDTLTGERVDKALASLDPSLSRTMIQRLIKTGAVFRMASPNAVFPAADSTPVNDPASAYRQIFSCTEKILSEGLFELRIPPAIPSEIIAEAIDLSIVFEDDHLLVVNKPAGMSTHPGAGPDGHKGTLVNALLHHCRGTLSGIGGVIRPGIVHRLDKGTSGLLVVAKKDPTHQHLSEQFKARTTTRLYLAIVKGTPHPVQGEIDAPIGRSTKVRTKMAVDPVRGRHAITRYTLVQSLSLSSLIACRLKTGRTHQIRVHMAHKGHPLLGDPLYSRPLTPPPTWPEATRHTLATFGRQALHAAKLGFIHPDNGKRLQFEVEAPTDFQRLLTALQHQKQPAPGLAP